MQLCTYVALHSANKHAHLDVTLAVMVKHGYLAELI